MHDFDCEKWQTIALGRNHIHCAPEQRPERGYMNALRRVPVTVEQQPRKCGLWRKGDKLVYREDREDRTVSSVSSG